MCGIFGCVLRGSQLGSMLYEALKRLEYRGYDSVGISYIVNGRLFVKKDKGEVEEVHKRLGLVAEGRIGIAHTRWATHGAPCMENAHPHTDCSQTIAVVHNGIIDNYLELREWLVERGHTFRSRTDTEVVPHLVEEYIKQGLPVREAVRRAFARCEGAFAFALITTYDPDRLYCARKESPLILGQNSFATFCASDLAAFLPYTRSYYPMHDGELAILSPDGIELIDLYTGEPRTIEFLTTNLSPEAITRGGFPHFMMKEIFEQVDSVRRALLVQKPYLRKMATTLLEADHIFLVACGTSYHAALAISYYLAKLAGIKATAVIASEFQDHYGAVVDERTLLLAVSQSGETADVLRAVRYAKERNARIAAIVNVMGSSLTRLSDIYIGQNSGPEIGVAATKTYTAQLTVGLQLALEAARIASNKTYNQLRARLRRIPQVVQRVLDTTNALAKKLASILKDKTSVCFLGRGLSHATALEGRLKFLEICYIPAIAYPAGESKHGFIAVVESGYPVIFVVDDEERPYQLTLSNMEEMEARGAFIAAVVTKHRVEEVKHLAKFLIPVPDPGHPLLTPITHIIPLQLLAYHASVLLGYNPDKPRNLAKSVTVV